MEERAVLNRGKNACYGIEGLGLPREHRARVGLQIE